MNWRRGFFRLWAVFAVGWIVFAYLYVNPGRDLFHEAFVTLPDIELRVPLDVTAERTRKVLIEYRAKTVPDTQLDLEVGQIMAEVVDVRRRNAAEHRFQWGQFAMTAAGVPIAVLFIGVIAGWVIGGFQRRSSKP